ncbi:unnamed protein product [Tetraodon nigroviridis]|uniref:(spotted green pufferfish) hypothetical protein n=1 Tax=Tetraodon nigroviridis TaxID=99883 RepID=Q4R9V4_TETNG|nr:unnamed protein product [Tetraodon nigroviridis]
MRMLHLSYLITDDPDLRRAPRALQNPAGGQQQPVGGPRLRTDVSGPALARRLGLHHGGRGRARLQGPSGVRIRKSWF